MTILDMEGPGLLMKYILTKYIMYYLFHEEVLKRYI